MDLKFNIWIIDRPLWRKYVIRNFILTSVSTSSHSLIRVVTTAHKKGSIWCVNQQKRRPVVNITRNPMKCSIGLNNWILNALNVTGKIEWDFIKCLVLSLHFTKFRKATKWCVEILNSHVYFNITSPLFYFKLTMNITQYYPWFAAISHLNFNQTGPWNL